MEIDSPEPGRTPHPDPEVEALLRFEPVVRKCVHHDGWLAGRQREFIIALTVLGHAEQAAIAVGGTMSGAYKLRTADGGEGGRIVAADYYVRQLTQIEIVLEAGGHAHTLLKALRLGGRSPLDIVATPMSLLLDQIRRQIWAEDGEPERPPLPPLGEHDHRIALGERAHRTSDLDGDYQQWVGRRAERVAINREAQRIWEEKARAEAGQRAEREGGSMGDSEAEGEAGEP